MSSEDRCSYCLPHMRKPIQEASSYCMPYRIRPLGVKVFSLTQKSIGPHTVYLIGQLYTSCTSHRKGDFIVQTVLYKQCSQYIYVPHKFRGPHPVYLIGEVNIAQVFTKSPPQRSSEEVLSIQISSQDTFYHVISCSLFLSSSLRSPMSRKDTEKS